ncbi:hypothetical protein [Alloscardovia omnicolens]|uniref:hypothetical protein n=1 Tax=Alloscardovia omnicolens TaxID=419015 RepID=UPI003A638765
MSTYVRRNQVITVRRNFNCGSSVMVNRYTRIDLNERPSAIVSTCSLVSEMRSGLMPGMNGECFDPDTCCDARERDMIAAIKECLRPVQAPASLYERLHECIDCLCD